MLACWFGFAGFLAAWVAARLEVGAGSRAPVVTLVALPAAWLFASARDLPGWEDGTEGALWLAGLGVMLATAAAAGWALRSSEDQPEHPSPAGDAPTGSVRRVA